MLVPNLQAVGSRPKERFLKRKSGKAKAGQDFCKQGWTLSGPILEDWFNDCKTSLIKSKKNL